MARVVVCGPHGTTSPAAIAKPHSHLLETTPQSLQFQALGKLHSNHAILCNGNGHFLFSTSLSPRLVRIERSRVGLFASFGDRTVRGGLNGAIDGGKFKRAGAIAQSQSAASDRLQEGRGPSEKEVLTEAQAEESGALGVARGTEEASASHQPSGGDNSESRNGTESSRKQGVRKESVLKRAMERAKAAAEGKSNTDLSDGTADSQTGPTGNVTKGLDEYSFADGPRDTVREDEIDDVIAEIGGVFEEEGPPVEVSPLELTPEEAVAMLPVGLMNRSREVREFYTEKERGGAVDGGIDAPRFDGKVDMAELRKRARWAEYGNEKGERIIEEGSVSEDVEQNWMVDLEDEEEELRRAEAAAQALAAKEVAERRSDEEDVGATDVGTSGLSEEAISLSDPVEPSGPSIVSEAPGASVEGGVLFAEEQMLSEPDLEARSDNEGLPSETEAQDLRTVPLDEFGDPVWNYQPEPEKPTEEEYKMAVGDLPPDLLEHLKKARDRQTEQDVEVLELGYDQVSGQQVPKWRRKLDEEENAKKEREKAQLEDYIFRKKLFTYAEKKGVKITETRHVYDDEGREISRDGKPVADSETQGEEARDAGREEQPYRYVRPDWEAPMEPFPDSDYSDLSDSDDEDESDGEEDAETPGVRQGEVSDAAGASVNTDGKVGGALMDGYEMMAGEPGYRAVLRTVREEGAASESDVGGNGAAGNGAAGTAGSTERGARKASGVGAEEKNGNRGTDRRTEKREEKSGEAPDLGDERLPMTYLKEDEDLGIDWGTEEYEDCFTDSDSDSDDEEADARASNASEETKPKGRMTEEHRKRLWAMHDALEARQKKGGTKGSKPRRNRTTQPPEEDEIDAEGSDNDVDPTQEELKKLAKQLEAALPKVTRENMELLKPVLEEFGLASESLSDLLLKPGFGNFMSDQLSKRTGTLARRHVKFPVAAVGKMLRDKGLRGRNIDQILASDKWEENRKVSPSKIVEGPGRTGGDGFESVETAEAGPVQPGNETDRVSAGSERSGESPEGPRLQRTETERSGGSSGAPAAEKFTSSDLMNAALMLEKGFQSMPAAGSTETDSSAEVSDSAPQVETGSRSEPADEEAGTYSEAESEELKRQLGLSGATLEDIFKDGILDKEEAMKNLREQLAEFEKEVEADVYWGAEPEPIPDDDVSPAVDRKNIHPTDGPIQFEGEEMTLAELAEMAKLTPEQDPFEQPLVTHITSAEWEDVTADPSPLVVEIFATWARPCRTMAVEVATLARTMGERVRVVKLNAEHEKALAAALRVKNVPSIIFIREHTVVMMLDSVVDLPGNDLVEIAEHVFFNGPFPECMKTAIERTQQQ